MTRYYYDFEFLEDGTTIEPISIGIVAEDGRELYLVNADAPWGRIHRHEWLMANVIPHLGDALTEDLYPNRTHPAVTSLIGFATEVRDFLLAAGPPELWGWYSAYDHVCLMQLWGTMMARPEAIPMWTNDLRQLCTQLGNPEMPVQQLLEHHALADARYNKIMHDFLIEQERAGIAALRRTR